MSVYIKRENEKKERILAEEERVVSSFAGKQVITSLLVMVRANVELWGSTVATHSVRIPSTVPDM